MTPSEPNLGNGVAPDPLTSAVADFNWEELYERLDGPSAFESQDRVELAQGLIRLLLGSDIDAAPNPKAVGLRAIALAWVLSPAYFPDAPSLRKLALACGVSPAALAQHTGEISRQIQFRSRAQRHAANWHPPEHPQDE